MNLFSEIGNLTSEISGLRIIPEYISNAQEADLIKNIDSQQWLTDLKRRVQHYGYRYNYKARSVNDNLKLGPLPNWLNFYVDALNAENLFSEKPDQVIINEYQPGQGISPHIDCIPCFGKTIISLSLGSQCVMEFSNAKVKQCIQLQPRSLLVLSGDARYKWKHSIPQRKSDKFNGVVSLRERRISLTFRKILMR